MTYQIVDTPTALQVVSSNGITRLFQKLQILEISLLKNNVIHIDMGTKKVFIAYTDITAPTSTSATDLIGTLNGFMYSDVKNRYTNISSLLSSISNSDSVIATNSNNFGTTVQPVLRITDNTNPNVVYNGYCNQLNTPLDTANLMIEKVITQDGSVQRLYPDGNNTAYNHHWAERETLNYI